MSLEEDEKADELARKGSATVTLCYCHSDRKQKGSHCYCHSFVTWRHVLLRGDQKRIRCKKITILQDWEKILSSSWNCMFSGQKRANIEQCNKVKNSLTRNFTAVLRKQLTSFPTTSTPYIGVVSTTAQQIPCQWLHEQSQNFDSGNHVFQRS